MFYVLLVHDQYPIICYTNMGRIKVKTRSPNEEKKVKLLRILSLNKVYATRLVTMNDGFHVITRTDEDLDKIVSKEIAKALN